MLGCGQEASQRSETDCVPSPGKRRYRRSEIGPDPIDVRLGDLPGGFCLQLVCTKHRFDLISFDFHEAHKYSHERFHELFCDANFRAPANAPFSAGSSSKIKLPVLKNEFKRVRIQILIRTVEIDALPLSCSANLHPALWASLQNQFFTKKTHPSAKRFVNSTLGRTRDSPPESRKTKLQKFRWTH
jgi:hypothetical protein